MSIDNIKRDQVDVRRRYLSNPKPHDPVTDPTVNERLHAAARRVVKQRVGAIDERAVMRIMRTVEA